MLNVFLHVLGENEWSVQTPAVPGEVSPAAQSYFAGRPMLDGRSSGPLGP